ncbi:MAG: diaminobutyrate acetyltransferase [Pseudomonadales bacterium]
MTRPAPEDGADLHDLIEACPPLDRNSRYCNLLQVSHFAETCVLARSSEGALLGSVSGYLKPEEPGCVFVWQVAVHPDGRGRGLAVSMLHELLARPACRSARYFETTIEADNAASWRLFERVARDLDAPRTTRVAFDRSEHFAGQHNTEMLLRVGPFRPPGESSRATSGTPPG